MADKTVEVRFPIPIQACFDWLIAIGKQTDEWKLVSADPKRFTMVWQQGGGFTSFKSPVQTTVALRPLGNSETEGRFTAHHYGLFDPLSYLDDALKKLIVPLQQHIARVQQTPPSNSGTACPRCGRPLPPGAKFCPADGARVNAECPNCRHINDSGARLCAKCGNAISAEKDSI
ncbi:MAG: zinc ribbon domain-containing protein [Chloroflexi bacterium]|nr:zinc ribbon domain-containing protein [Chloroflexota bacterium]